MFSKSARPRILNQLCSSRSRILAPVLGRHSEFSSTHRLQHSHLLPSLQPLSAQLFDLEDDNVLEDTDERQVSIERPFATTICNIFKNPKGISVLWGDGHESLFHYIWLRDCCQCPACLHPCSKERLLDTSRLPLSVSADRVAIDQDGNLEIIWNDSQENHRSVFKAEWLREHCYSESSRKKQQDKKHDNKIIWDTSISSSMPEIDYQEVMNEDAGFKKWLDLLDVYGFALMRNVPQSPGQCVMLAKKIAYPKETFWGASYDVIAESNPANLSLTGLELKCHTDFSWSEFPPNYQFLHCLKMDKNIKGGDSILVDGFKVAEVLKQKHPYAYRLLTRVKLPYYFKGENAHYTFSGPVFQLDGHGDLIGVRYNQANRGPLSIPEESVEDTYDALQKFAGLISHPKLAIRFHLQPGDLLAFNNRRILHGRGAFSESCERHLEGCYVDGEEFMSRFTILERKLDDNTTAAKATDSLNSAEPSYQRTVPKRFIKTSPALSSLPFHPSRATLTRNMFHTHSARQLQGKAHMSTFRPDQDVSAEVAAVYGDRKEVSFVHMKDGTKDDYEFMGLVYDLDMQKNMVNRVLNLLEPLKGVKNGGKIDLYDHSLQAATRALKDNADEETIVCALLHDVGELLSPQNHGEIPAAILKPFITPENHWVLANHEVFQGYYYFHFLGGDKHTRDVYKAHPCYERAIEFCEKYDQSSFDPSYENLPLETFLPMVRRVFARKAYFHDPHNPKTGCVTGRK